MVVLTIPIPIPKISLMDVGRMSRQYGVVEVASPCDVLFWNTSVLKEKWKAQLCELKQSNNDSGTTANIVKFSMRQRGNLVED